MFCSTPVQSGKIFASPIWHIDFTGTLVSWSHLGLNSDSYYNSAFTSFSGTLPVGLADGVRTADSPMIGSLLRSADISRMGFVIMETAAGKGYFSFLFVFCKQTQNHSSFFPLPAKIC